MTLATILQQREGEVIQVAPDTPVRTVVAAACRSSHRRRSCGRRRPGDRHHVRTRRDLLAPARRRRDPRMAGRTRDDAPGDHRRILTLASWPACR